MSDCFCNNKRFSDTQRRKKSVIDPTSRVRFNQTGGKPHDWFSLRAGGSVQSGPVSKVLVVFINGSHKRETPQNSSVDRQKGLPVAAILFLSHRWEEVEKQSFRVKGLELSVGQRGRGQGSLQAPTKKETSKST